MKLQQALRKLSKLLYKECDTLQRNLKDIWSSINSLKQLLKDQLNLMINSLTYKIQECMNSYKVQIIAEQKKLKYELEK